MTPLQKLKSLLEKKGIYREAVNLLREHRRLIEASIADDPKNWIIPQDVLDRQRRFAPQQKVTPTPSTNTRANDPVSALADRTQNAYSYNRYGEDEWRACIAMLLKRGYSETDVEHILRSKWMRWAGDVGINPDAPTTQDLEQFLDNPRHRAGPKYLYSIRP